MESQTPSVVFYAAEAKLRELVELRRQQNNDIELAKAALESLEESRGDTVAMMQDLAVWLGQNQDEADEDPDAYFRIHGIPKPEPNQESIDYGNNN